DPEEEGAKGQDDPHWQAEPALLRDDVPTADAARGRLVDQALLLPGTQLTGQPSEAFCTGRDLAGTRLARWRLCRHGTSQPATGQGCPESTYSSRSCRSESTLQTRTSTTVGSMTEDATATPAPDTTAPATTGTGPEEGSPEATAVSRSGTKTEHEPPEGASRRAHWSGPEGEVDYEAVAR